MVFAASTTRELPFAMSWQIQMMRTYGMTNALRPHGRNIRALTIDAVGTVKAANASNDNACSHSATKADIAKPTYAPFRLIGYCCVRKEFFESTRADTFAITYPSKDRIHALGLQASKEKLNIRPNQTLELNSADASASAHWLSIEMSFDFTAVNRSLGMIDTVKAWTREAIGLAPLAAIPS